MPSTDALSKSNDPWFKFLGFPGAKTKAAHGNSAVISIKLRNGLTGRGVKKEYTVTVQLKGKGVGSGEQITFIVQAISDKVALAAVALVLSSGKCDYLKDSFRCDIEVTKEGNKLLGRVTDLTNGEDGATFDLTIGGMIFMIDEIARRANIKDQLGAGEHLAALEGDASNNLDELKGKINVLMERARPLRIKVMNTYGKGRKVVQRQFDAYEPPGRWSGFEGDGSVKGTFRAIPGGIKQAWKKRWTLDAIGKELQKQRNKAKPIKALIEVYRTEIARLQRALNEARANREAGSTESERNLIEARERLEVLTGETNYQDHLRREGLRRELEQLNEEIATLRTQAETFIARNMRKITVRHHGVASLRSSEQLQGAINAKQEEIDAKQAEINAINIPEVFNAETADREVAEAQREVTGAEGSVQGLDERVVAAEATLRAYYAENLESLYNILQQVNKKIAILKAQLKERDPS